MAIVESKAIVLSAIKYGDTSLIVKCFTKAKGIKSYMVKGVLKAKRSRIKTGYFQPLTQVILTANYTATRSLYTIKEIQAAQPYTTVPNSIVKQTIVLFLAEVLSYSIQEEEENETLYTYIETALLWLDTHEEVANFHLLFLLQLTKYLGFYPANNTETATAFNLAEGQFVSTSYEKLSIVGKKLYHLKLLLGINFDTLSTVFLNKEERQALLQVIIQYFELHLDGFKKPKSLAVLETVFK